MGLLDTWREWKKNNKSYSSGFEDYGSLNTAGGVEESTDAFGTMLNRKDRKPTGQFDFNPLQKGKTNLPQGMLTDQAKKNQAALIQQQGTPIGEMPSNLGDKGYHKDEAEQLNWWQTLAKKAGIKDFDEAAANWKEKGGFEGLMSNPGFTLGLALMQSSAQGKTIGAGVLDNFVKAAGISAQFKDRMKARAGGVIEATEGQMKQIKSVLATKGIDKPGWWRQMFPGNQSEAYEQAVEDVAVEVQKKVNKMKADAEASGKDIVVGNKLYKKIIDDMIANEEIKRVGGVKLGGYQIIDSSLEDKSFKAQGGPVTKGQPYVVGERGPEYFLPKESGKVVSNDDSRIFAMLLAANPQLQQVSKTRAERIIRSRFPEYFD